MSCAGYEDRTWFSRLLGHPARPKRSGSIVSAPEPAQGTDLCGLLRRAGLTLISLMRT